MEKTLELCTPCAGSLRSGYTVKMVRHKVNCKITCANCGRRRYGDTYSVISKRGKEDKA